MTDRRTLLMTGGGIALATGLAVGAIAGSVALFGLTDDPSRVGKLSPIDAERRSTVTTPAADAPPPSGAPAGTPGATVAPPGPTAGSAPSPAPATGGSPPTTTVTAPEIDDHGDDPDDDSSGSGSSSSGRDDHDDD